MANKFPLIVNSSAGQIQEIQGTDDLELPGQLKLTGTSSISIGDIVSTGGNDANFGLFCSASVSNSSKITVVGRNNANNGNVTIADFIVGGSDAPQVNIPGSTASSNKTTGALVVTGGVGIGGALNVGGDITAFSTSDKNLKENLVPIPNAVDKVGIITGYTYKWKTAGTDHSAVDGEEDTGVIAQDVEVLGLPGITTTREDGTKAISYKRLTPLLIQAIKELDARIKTLEG